jgi:MerR HTH family regulatory protein
VHSSTLEGASQNSTQKKRPQCYRDGRQFFHGVPMSMHYQIGEFAELGGVSAKTLRFYDEIGVFRPASVDPRTGYRRYSPQQLEELASILALKNLGVPLARLRELRGKRGRLRLSARRF